MPGKSAVLSELSLTVIDVQPVCDRMGTLKMLSVTGTVVDPPSVQLILTDELPSGAAPNSTWVMVPSAP